MNLDALQHLVRSARTLADDCEIIVLGSSSLLASFPELGEDTGLLAATYDADLCPQPFDETTALMMHEALGESRAFHLRHGYHADILRDAIFETLPMGWRDRLKPVPGSDGALALEPNDLAATKLFVGRPKDISLVQSLARSGRLSREVVNIRLDSIIKTERQIPACHRAFREAFDSV